MTDEHHDLTWHSLKRLAVLEPDPERARDVRQRGRAVLARRQLESTRNAAPEHLRAFVLQSGAVCGLSVAYLFALIDDLLEVYLRR
jgi:hypothetical protein